MASRENHFNFLLLWHTANHRKADIPQAMPGCTLWTKAGPACHEKFFVHSRRVVVCCEYDTPTAHSPMRVALKLRTHYKAQEVLRHWILSIDD